MAEQERIDPAKVKVAIDRILALKSEVTTLRERMEAEQLTRGKERALRESIEEELERLRAASESGNGSPSHVSQEVIKKVMEAVPDKIAAILRRKGEAFLPGLGRFVLRYGPEGSVVGFEPDEGFIGKL